MTSHRSPGESVISTETKRGEATSARHLFRCRSSAAIAVRLALALALTPILSAQLPQTRLLPSTYHSNFAPNPGASPASGSRDGWESFPITQETGYEPSLQPETAHGQSILTREQAPTEDGPFQLGFIRRVHMTAGPGAFLSLRLRAPWANGPSTVHLSIFRGEREETHTATLNGSAWRQIHASVAASNDPITAIAIAVDYPHAVHTRPERLLMADVELHALATRRLDLRQPAALWDPARELYYLQHALRPGESLHLAAALSPGTSWSLTTAASQPAAAGKGSRVDWTLPENAAPGIWTLTLASPSARATVLLLVQSTHRPGLLFDTPPAIPPKLLASIEERRSLLRKTAQPGSGANIALMDPHWLLPGLPSYFNILLQSSELAMLDAMAFRATGDPAARDEADTLLRAIARWPQWVHPWFPAHGYHSYYPVGIMTKYVVMAEQFLGSSLAPDARLQLDRALMTLSVKPIYEEYVHEDRLQFNTSNWIGNTVGGALLAALQSDDPDAPGYALGLYIKERDHVAAAYTPDGSYGEGVTYQRFDLEMTTLVAEAAKRHLGTSIDRDLLPPERYMRYASYGTEGLMDFGDSHVDITPSNVFAYLAALNQSSSLAAFYFQYRDQGTAELLSRVLWESSILPPAAPIPPEPASANFPQRGIAVLRDSSSPDATVVAMRAGKNFNHNHADEGSLFYARNGLLWLGEAGYADYYKDPSYNSFYTQAIGHNTLLVDGDPESQALPGNAVFGSAPSVTHTVFAEPVSLVQADLTSVYRGRLERYTRSLILHSGGPLIVIDDVQSRTPRRFTQLWHPNQPFTLAAPGDAAFVLTHGTSQIHVQSFALGPIAATAEPSPMPLVDYERAEHGPIDPPRHIEVTATTSRTSETIVTVIEPQDAAHSVLAQPHWKTTDRLATLTLGDTGIALPALPALPAGRAGPCRTLTAWWPTGAIALCVTRYSDRSFPATIAADSPIDLKLQRGEGRSLQLDIDAAGPTALHLTGLVPADTAAGTTQRIPAGHTTLQLLYR